MATHTIQMRDKGYCWSTDHVLVTSWHAPNPRWGVCFIPRGSEGRQVYQGPMVPGPWASAFGLASVIAANPEHGTYGEMRRKAAAQMVHDVAVGDTVVLCNEATGAEMARFQVEREERAVNRGWLLLC